MVMIRIDCEEFNGYINVADISGVHAGDTGIKVYLKNQDTAHFLINGMSLEVFEMYLIEAGVKIIL